MIDIHSWTRHRDWWALTVPKCGCSSLRRVALDSWGMQDQAIEELNMLNLPARRPHLMAYPLADRKPRYVFYRDAVERLASVYMNKVATKGDPLFEAVYGMTASQFLTMVEKQMKAVRGAWQHLDMHIRPQAWFWQIGRAWCAEFMPMCKLHRLVGGTRENATGSDPAEIWTPEEIDRVRKLYSMDSREINLTGQDEGCPTNGAPGGDDDGAPGGHNNGAPGGHALPKD